MRTAKNLGLYLPHSKPVDFSDWDLTFNGKNLGDVILSLMQSAMVETLASPDWAPHTYFPFNYGNREDGIGGPPVDNPLIIDVCLNFLSSNEDEGPTFRFNLQECLRWEYLHETGEADAEALTAVRNSLLEIAAEFTKAIEATK